MTDPSPNCPDCGTALPEDSPQQLCPSCLLKQAFASRTVDQAQTELSPPPSPEEIAEKFPQFEITECLGRGGMGVVYKARQKSLNRWVAIKVLAPERVDDEKFAERFTREAQTLAQLNHPNIVTVHDYGETDGLYFIVMEFVDGVNLRDLLHDGKIESAQALTIVPPICEALQYAHDKGIVHRDIKPENLLIDRDGRVKIADFGIASLVGATGEQSGTPPYMAPEQGAHVNVDHRADIYALGAVLYEMLTGDRPASPLDLPSQKVQLDIRIDDIVLRALNKEPERRYRTANEFRTVVETVVDRKAVADPPTLPASPATSPVPHARESRTLAIIAVILAALITIVAIPLGLLWLNTPQKTIDSQPFHKVVFQVSHPDVISGNSTITRNVRQGSETDWSPSTGQELTLKDQGSLYFRCKVIAESSGASQAFLETSHDQKTWKSESRTINPSAYDSFTLPNGITCKISNKLGPNPEPKSPAPRIGPLFVIGASLLLLLAAIIWVVKSDRPRNDSEPTPTSTPRRSMFRRWWWIMLSFVLIGPIVGIFGGMLLGDLSPKKFETSSIIQVNPKTVNGIALKSFAEIYSELLSTENLRQVADRHELSKRWEISDSDVIPQLKKSIQLSNLRGTDLIEIRVQATGTGLARRIANSLPDIAAKNSSSIGIIVHQQAGEPKTPVVQLRKWILIGAPLGLLLAPLLALAMMVILQRLIPDRNPSAGSQEISEEQKLKNASYGKIAFWLFLAATLGTLVMMTLSSRHDMALIFGGVALFLSLIFGLMSRRRGVVIALIAIVILFAVLTAFSALIFYWRLSSAQSIADEEEQRAQSAAELAKSAAREQAFESALQDVVAPIEDQLAEYKSQNQSSGGLTFGPIIERIVYDDRPGATEVMIDFDTGRLITPPSSEIANWEWTKANGIDAIGCTDTDVLGLLSTGGTVIVPTTEEAWLTPDVAQVRQVAIPLSATEQGGVAFPGTEGLPSTFIFKTRGRALGLLQIVGLTGDSSATKIRYRLMVDKDDPMTKAEDDFERVARLHMEAVSRMDLKAARAFWLPYTELSKKTDAECLPNLRETNRAFEKDPALMTTFSEWYRIGGYALARVTQPEESDGRSIYLILGHSPNGWGIIQIDDIRQDESLSDKFEEYAESH